ncbi:MAG TPA: CHAT domain-containing protein [Blastocatellia bacterium]|nr:CHAT domain-containing protein [Blastocatellia bacterium]
MKILFLAANPVDVVTQLRIDQEIREIRRKIRTGTLRDHLEVVSEWAVRAGDLQEALLRHQPDIVHFSGHSSQTSGIILEDEAGNRKAVNRKALLDLFRILKDNVRMVVLNACYARDQAKALATTIDFTIGMNSMVEDKAAIVFASHFYQSLAFGRSVKESFDLAVNQLELEGLDVAHMPELLVRDGANAASTRIVRPHRRAVEPKNKPAKFRGRKVAVAGAKVRPTLIPKDKPNVTISGQAMRGLACEEQKGKPRALAFLLWLFASVAINLTTDVLRRLFISDGGRLNMICMILQSVLIALAVIAAVLAVISLVRPASSPVVKAASLGVFKEPRNVQRVAILTGIAPVIALGVWLSLPVFAHYYNEKGIEFQYSEHPDLLRARESYQRAVRLKPSYAQAHYNLAIVEEDLQPEKAMEEYRLAIKHDSHIYSAYNNLARLYLRRGKDNDYENALNILSQAETLSPQDEDMQYSLNKNLGWTNYAVKHYPVAEVYLRRAISLKSKQGGAAAHCLLAYVLREQGKAGVDDECFDCVKLAPGEEDIEAKWLNDAKECCMKGGSK